MADKIDQLKIGSTSYDIDLPADATPSIASLTTSGNVQVGGNLTDGTNSMTVAQIGKVKTVNSTAPDANGNVSLSIPDNSNLVHKTGDETIGGTKTFTSRPQLSQRLPDTYQEVEYIVTDGNQYIDTGTAPGTALVFDIKLSITTASSAKLVVQGNYGLRTTPNFVNYVSGKRFSGSSVTLNTIYSVQGSNSFLTVNGVSGVQETDSDTPSGNVTLFKDTIGRLYSCRLWNGETLVRNFVPCYRKSDNEIGLYDLVNDVFYDNDGSGTFTKGSNITANALLIESDLATVAITGDYDDLNNKPSIPTISASATAVSGATEAKSLTINGTNWNLPSGGGGSGTVTSVDLSMPTGFTVSGNPITSSGTLAVTLSSGYELLNSNSAQTIAGSKRFTDTLQVGAESGHLSIGPTSIGTDLSALTIQPSSDLNLKCTSGSVSIQNNAIKINSTVLQSPQLTFKETVNDSSSQAHTATYKFPTADKTTGQTYTIATMSDVPPLTASDYTIQ